MNGLVIKNVFSYSLRKSLNIVVSRPRTEQARRSLKHRAAIAWSSLPDTIKQLENSLSFKTKIKSIKSYVWDISFQKECSGLSLRETKNMTDAKSRPWHTNFTQTPKS